MLRKHAHFLLIILGVVGINSCSNSGHEPATLALDSNIEQRLDSLLGAMHGQGFHGVVAIGTQTGISYHSAFGLANRVWDVPNDVDTRFDIASLNKSLIAGLVLLAVEEGKLSLTQSLSSILGSMEYSPAFSSEITLHQLLTHTSGLPDYDGVAESLKQGGFRGLKRMHFDRPSEYARFISELPMASRAGEQFHYSNFAYHVLAIVLEQTYQISFDQLLQKKICEPLGMENTYAPRDNQRLYPKVAEGYSKAPEGEWKRNSFIDFTVGRRVFSTAGDMHKWLQSMNDGRLFQKTSLSVMHQNHLKEVQSQLSYGYGWVVYGEGEHYPMGDLDIEEPYLIHGGRTEGYRSIGISINRGEWIISILCNSVGESNEMELAKGVVELLLGEALKKP